MVRSLHDAGIEVILDVVYNHTAEGNHLGPTLELQGPRQPGVLPPGRGRPALLHGLHGHREHPQRPPPALAAADHGLAALLGDRDARRRLPVRPRLRAGARVLRRRPAVDLLRARAAGPGRQPGEADRRAVGRRSRRLPGRQLPAAVDRVERQVPRHRPGLLARRGRPWASSRAGSPGRATSTSRPAAARSPRSTSSPRTTASRCATSSPTTTSTTTPTARTTSDGESHNRSWNCGVEGPTDDPEILALRARQQRNFLATLLLSQGVPMLLHGDELGRTQQATTTPTRQDYELSLDRTGTTSTSRWSSSPRTSPGCAATTRRSAVAASSPARPCARPRGEGERLNDIVWLHLDGRAMEHGRLGGTGGQVDRHVPQRPRHRGVATRAASTSSTTTS